MPFPSNQFSFDWFFSLILFFYISILNTRALCILSFSTVAGPIPGKVSLYILWLFMLHRTNVILWITSLGEQKNEIKVIKKRKTSVGNCEILRLIYALPSNGFTCRYWQTYMLTMRQLVQKCISYPKMLWACRSAISCVWQGYTTKYKSRLSLASTTACRGYIAQPYSTSHSSPQHYTQSIAAYGRNKTTC